MKTVEFDVRRSIRSHFSGGTRAESRMQGREGRVGRQGSDWMCQLRKRIFLPFTNVKVFKHPDGKKEPVEIGKMNL